MRIQPAPRPIRLLLRFALRDMINKGTMNFDTTMKVPIMRHDD